MESIRYVLFDDPSWLIIALAVLEVVAAASWWHGRSPRRLVWVAAPIVLAGGLYALERYVVTDRERIVAACEEIAAMAGRGEFGQAAEKYLAEDFSGRFAGAELDKRGVLVRIRTATALEILEGVTLRDPELEFREGGAVVKVGTTLRFQESRRDYWDWELGWRKTPEGWRIDRLIDARRAVPL
jgi:hypothetical protein